MMAAVMAQFGSRLKQYQPPFDSPAIPRRRGNDCTSFTPNGERECARRRRQIAKGIIKVSA